VVNARDAIEDAGRVEIAVQSLPSGLASLSVSDNGVGMDAETRASIFDPFFTTKSKDRGTGLGLMVVEQVANELGARITIDSAVGEGTRFSLLIPTEHAISSVASPGKEMGSEVVLLVDDDVAVRGAIGRGLRRLGYTVLEAKDGELALRVSERHRGSIDVLVTDSEMPSLSGSGLAAAFRRQRPTVPCILITGGHGAVSPELFDALLRKPFTPEELATTLRSVLANAQTKAAISQT